MQLQDLPNSSSHAPPSRSESILGSQSSAQSIDKQSWPTPQCHLASGNSKSSRATGFEGVANTKPLQIAVKIDDAASSAQLRSLKVFEIEAVNLSYKAPTPAGLVNKLTVKLSRKNCDKPTFSSTFIVKDVSFTAKSGELLAVAGPSGAGKSTLLELLAGNLRPSSPSGSILINKQPMNVVSFHRISGYIPQNDALFPLLSVRETLLFSAQLRLPSSVTSAEKQERVDALLSELRLKHVADTHVGNEAMRGISGGEKKRVSIGVDVIHDPAVLLLDEPTSGLDSASALNVIEMLCSMAKTRSRTIILTIHQPGYRIIQQINSLLLLADGHVVHHGSLQHLHYKLLAKGHIIPLQVNTLEYAIENIACEIIALPRTHPDFKERDTVHQHIIRHDTVGRIHKETVHADTNHNSSQAKIAAPAFANSSIREILVLSQRFTFNVFRTYKLFTARTMQALFAGLALGLIYIHVGTNIRGVIERMGFFAFTLTFLLSTTVEALPIFLQERHVFIRETTRGSYRISSYLMANFLVFLPFLLMLAVLFSAPVYWLIGLSSKPSAFCFFVLVVWLVLLMANAFVAFFSALVPDYIMGYSMISGCMGAFFLFSGYFISKQDMPSYWRFMHYISLFKYPLDALLINEYRSMQGTCFGMKIGGGGCTFTSEDVLAEVGLARSSKWTNVLVMIMFVCLYRLLGYAVLQYKLCKISR
ncbi:hypothetical protein L7F22_002412 [Adiantum nelumboides]|nr:hypothetical protein [Adiantum nelumboides]